MKLSPSRGKVRRKWGLDKSSPQILASEYLLKALIAHGWPCQTEQMGPRVTRFLPVAGRDLGPDFWAACDAALRVVSKNIGFEAVLDGDCFRLVGPYHVDRYGKLKRGPLPPPFDVYPRAKPDTFKGKNIDVE